MKICIDARLDEKVSDWFFYFAEKKLKKVVYKKLLPAASSHKSLTLGDVASLDPELARGLEQLLDFEPAEQVEHVFCRNFKVRLQKLTRRSSISSLLCY